MGRSVLVLKFGVGRRLLSLGVVGLALCSSACLSVHLGYIEEDKQEAIKAIEQFHLSFSVGRFDEIYNKAHPIFQQAKGREEFVKTIRQTKDQIGRFQKLNSCDLKVFPNAQVQIRAECRSSF